MSMIVQSALADLDHEIANTRRMLQLVPADQLEFRPHEKSWPLQRLANHLADLVMLGHLALTTDVFDLASMPPQPAAPTTADGFVELFDRRVSGFKDVLAAATDEQMSQPWTMKKADYVILTMPRVAVLRTMMINHLIHHRGQFSLYLRMLNIPLPGLYGPSADEQ